MTVMGQTRPYREAVRRSALPPISDLSRLRPFGWKVPDSAIQAFTALVRFNSDSRHFRLSPVRLEGAINGHRTLIAILPRLAVEGSNLFARSSLPKDLDSFTLLPRSPRGTSIALCALTYAGVRELRSEVEPKTVGCHRPLQSATATLHHREYVELHRRCLLRSEPDEYRVAQPLIVAARQCETWSDTKIVPA